MKQVPLEVVTNSAVQTCDRWKKTTEPGVDVGGRGECCDTCLYFCEGNMCILWEPE
jgi:hypothetical protein